MKSFFKKNDIIGHLVILIVIVLISSTYFYPKLLGKQLQQADITGWRGMSKELRDYRKETGTEALWTNRAFGGMPSYMISTPDYPGNLIAQTFNFYKNNSYPIGILALYLLGYYFLLSTLGMSKWQSLAGAIAFGFSSYFIIIIGAGHITKAYAIGLMAPIIAGILMVFNKRRISGVLLFSIALSLQIDSNHLQITYYTLILVILLGIALLINDILNKELKRYTTNIGLLTIGLLIAIGMNFSQLYLTWEFSKESNRGKSELTQKDKNKTSGLDRDYIIQHSHGIDEVFTLLIPNFKGGSSRTEPGEDSETFKVIRQNIQNARKYSNMRLPYYHGDKPFTDGPVYVGAIIVFLFVIALFVVRGPYLWWLLSATIISIVLSWGKNVMGLTNFLIDYLPFYNKFRAPDMILVISEFTIPLLGFIGLHKIFSGQIPRNEIFRAIKYSFFIVGGSTLFIGLFPSITGNFYASTDAAIPDWLNAGVIADRKIMLRSDAFRSFIFVLLGSFTLYLWYLKKIKVHTFLILIGILILVDLWTVDKRYFNNSNFSSKRELRNSFKKTTADKAILQDKDLSYRVLTLKNPFNNAHAPFYYQSLGGNSAVRLKRYNELIENHIFPEIERLTKMLKVVGPSEQIFFNLSVLNMLNTRYIIHDSNKLPIYNKYAYGNGWFVTDYKFVKNADEEIKMLNYIDPAKTAIIDQRFAKLIDNKTFSIPENAMLELTEYKPNYLKYTFNSDSEQLTMFSEIYYPKGWTAHIDGVESPHFRANYVLRAMVIPKGQHLIEFRFEPKSYYYGNLISYISSIILILIILGYTFVEFKRLKQKPNTDLKTNIK